MPTRSNLAARCGASLLLIAFAAACSSGTATAPAGAQGSTGAQRSTGAVVAGATAPGQAPGGGADSVADGLGHPVNVCTLLPVATVASITSEPLTAAAEDDTPSIKLYTCNYSSADGTSGLSVSVLAMDAAAGYDAELQATQAVVSPKPISGLGDKAFSGPLGLKALFHNVSIGVTGLQSDAAAEALIRALQPKL